MEILQVDPSNRKQVQSFLTLPMRIYNEIPQWVPPLAGDARLRFDKRHYPYYKHSEAAFFLAVDHGVPVGSLAVLDNRHYNEHNHTNTAFFYLFECENSQPVADALFESGFSWAKGRELDRIAGPKGFTALDGLGLLVKGFDLRPALGLPYNPAYYVPLIESLGFEKDQDIVSGFLARDLQFPQRIHDLAARIQQRRGLSILRFRTRSDLRRNLYLLKDLYNQSLEGTGEATPLTDQEFNALVEQMIWFADPRLIKIVMKGERPVGFLLAYPDISTALQKISGRLFPLGWITLLRELRTTDTININGAGLIEELRGLGGTAVLYSELFKSVMENPRYRQFEVVQIGLENDKMQREMENFGVDFCKMHRTYVRRL